MPERILFIHDGKMNNYGLDLVSAQQVQALAQAGFEVDLLARGPLSHPNVRSMTRRYTWANLFSGISRLLYFDARKRAFAALGRSQLRRQSYAAVVGWVGGMLPVVRETRETGIPLLLNVPRFYEAGQRATVCSDNSADSRALRWPRISQSDRRREYQDAPTHLLLPSAYARTVMEAAGVPGERLHVIERGYDPENFYPPDHLPDKFRLLFCGKIGSRKGVLQALQAWREAALGNAEFWFAGRVSGATEQKWLQAAGESVRYLGFRKDIGDVMRQCHAQILLSGDEGQAKSLIEGAACGLVTIATPVTGFPFHRGELGFEVSAEDVHTVASILRRMHDEPELHRRYAGESVSVMRRYYTWPAFRSRFTDVVEKALRDPLASKASQI